MLKHLILEHLDFGGLLDIDSELEIEIDCSSCNYCQSIWINKEQAKEIVNHLKTVFGGTL